MIGAGDTPTSTRALSTRWGPDVLFADESAFALAQPVCGLAGRELVRSLTSLVDHTMASAGFQG